MPKQTAADIDRIAADRVVREDRRALSPAEQAELDAWLAADARRQGAYVRAHAAWSMLDRGRAMASDVAPPRRWPLATRRELMAASLVGVAGLGGLLTFRELGQERLVGYFRANDPESFVRAAADTLGAQVSLGERELRLRSSAGV